MRKNSILNNLSLSVVTVALALCACMNAFFAGGSVRVFADSDEKVINIFSWEDYIDEGYDNEDDASDYLLEHYEWQDLTKGVIQIFEEENPGYTVNYYTFSTNEEMYNELLKDPTACDLICPSEYMILKMKEEGLIKEYDIPQSYKDNGSKYIQRVFESLGLANNDKAYAIGYMWGTMGLVYNMDKFSASDFTNWSNLFDEKFSGKTTIKDSLRDTYIMAVAMVYEEELLSLKEEFESGNISDYNQDGNRDSDDYTYALTRIFNRTDKETVDKVCDMLIDLKRNLYGFEVDSGKNDLITGKIDINFAWSGDAVAAMFDGDDAGVNLGYVVPEEGSNVWFDGWVMTKNADEQAAGKFLDFICRPENVIRNMEYIGYTSCMAGEEVFDYVKANFEDEDGTNKVNLKYFFSDDGTQDYIVNVSDENMGRYLYAQYADEETILRCAVMDNFSNEDLETINEMWNKVKLITLPTAVLITIAAVVLLAIVAVPIYKYRDKLFAKTLSAEQTKPRKKGYKVIKIENIDR